MMSYIASHKEEIEAALAEAVNNVFKSQPEKPLEAICEVLSKRCDQPQHARQPRNSREPMDTASSNGLLVDTNAPPVATKEERKPVLDANSEPIFTTSRGTTLPASIAVATSNRAQTGEAIREAARSLYEQLDGAADLVLCFCTEHHLCADVEAVARVLFGRIPFAANTTHGGLVTQLGPARHDGTQNRPGGLALWALRDEAGAFAVAGAPVTADANYAAAGISAVKCARSDVEKLTPAAPSPQDGARGSSWSPHDGDDAQTLPPSSAGEPPIDESSGRRHEELLWLLTAPGEEESVLEAIRASGLPPRTVLLGRCAYPTSHLPTSTTSRASRAREACVSSRARCRRVWQHFCGRGTQWQMVAAGHQPNQPGCVRRFLPDLGQSRG